MDWWRNFMDGLIDGIIGLIDIFIGVWIGGGIL